MAGVDNFSPGKHNFLTEDNEGFSQFVLQMLYELLAVHLPILKSIQIGLFLCFNVNLSASSDDSLVTMSSVWSNRFFFFFFFFF
jgi:hypothetical protein